VRRQVAVETEGSAGTAVGVETEGGGGIEVGVETGGGGGNEGHVSTTGVHNSEKKEVCGQPAAETGARARDGIWSRYGGSGAIAPRG
jgi:hypothetical protein